MLLSVSQEVLTMRTTVKLDDELVKRAEELTGITERSQLVRDALKALIARESARRLALLGGSEPDLHPVPRRRPRKW
jgi:Arc/MetJ family transcription regulator